MDELSAALETLMMLGSMTAIVLSSAGIMLKLRSTWDSTCSATLLFLNLSEHSANSCSLQCFQPLTRFTRYFQTFHLLGSARDAAAALLRFARPGENFFVIHASCLYSQLARSSCPSYPSRSSSPCLCSCAKESTVRTFRTCFKPFFTDFRHSELGLLLHVSVSCAGPGDRHSVHQRVRPLDSQKLLNPEQNWLTQLSISIDERCSRACTTRSRRPVG